jgi:hypothetical protein
MPQFANHSGDSMPTKIEDNAMLELLGVLLNIVGAKGAVESLAKSHDKAGSHEMANAIAELFKKATGEQVNPRSD